MPDDSIPQVNRGGRPRKPKPQESEAGEMLTEARAEAERDVFEANLMFRKAPTMANKAAMLAAEMRVAGLLRAWCSLCNDHTHAIRWAEVETKLADKHAAAAEADAIDRARELADKTKRERAARLKLGGGS